jgi:hypothetical protein
VGNPCPSVTFTISAAEFTALQAKLQAAGFAITGVSGQGMQYKHCTFDWSYANGVLTITCTDYPHFWVDCATIAKDLAQLVTGNGL